MFRFHLSKAFLAGLLLPKHTTALCTQGITTAVITMKWKATALLEPVSSVFEGSSTRANFM